MKRIQFFVIQLSLLFLINNNRKIKEIITVFIYTSQEFATRILYLHIFYFIKIKNSRDIKNYV